MTLDDDADLRQEFAALRASDRARTPGFQATIAAARRRVPLRAPVILWRVAAALVLLTAGAATWQRLHPRAEAQLVAIASWRSPTSSLLVMPGTLATDSVPRVSASLVRPFGAAPARTTTSPTSGHAKGDTT